MGIEMEMLQHGRSCDVFRQAGQLTCKAFFFFCKKTSASANLPKEKTFQQQVYKDKTSLCVWDLLNTKVIRSEGRVTSPVPTSQSELFLQVSDFASLCVLQVFLSDFVSFRASQQWRCSPEVLTHVPFISLVGCKGPPQWREIRAAPCLLVFKWA